MKKPIVVLSIVLVSLASLGLGMFASTQIRKSEEIVIPGLLWPNPKQLQPFTMQDHEGKEFGLEELKGNWSFLFFGYTNCPDICPMTLTVLSQAYGNIKNEDPDKNIQVIFVSVDPERDDQQILKPYVNYFNPEFIGLAGTIDQMHSLTRQMGIPYYYSEPDESGNYNVDHPASLFLIDKQARLVGIFSGQHQQNDIISRFKIISDFIINQG